MKRMLAAAVMATACGFGGVGQAAPLDPATVSADAKWLIHVDFDAAHESKVVNRIHDEALQHEGAKKMLAKIQDAVGMDPHKDIHGVTLYGTNFKMHSGVLIVYAHADHEKVIALLKKHSDYKVSKEGDVEVHSWTEHHGEHQQKMQVAFPKSDVAVAASSEDDLKAALATLGGKGGLGSSSPLLGDAPKGTIFRMAVVGINKIEMPIKMPIIEKIEQVSVVIGEHDGQSFDHTKVKTTGEDTAKEMKSVAEGFRGMADLHLGDRAPEIKKLIDAAKIEASGATLTIDWTGSADDVIKAGESAAKEMKEHHKAFEELHQRAQKRAGEHKDGHEDADKKRAKKDGDK